MEVSIVVIDEL